MAYNPADFELVDAPAGSAPPYNPADFDLVAEPEGSGFWRQAADLPVSAMGGVVTGLKGMTDVFGANNPVSQELGSYQQFYNQALSPEAQADQQEVARIMQEAQDKGMWEQIKAGGRAFATAPLDTMAQSLGTMAPIVATGVAGKAFGLGARGVQIAQAASGSGMQMGIVKDSIYQNTKQFLMQRGKSEEEADRVALEAQSYGGQNLDQILLGAGLGALDALTGVESILGRTISKTGNKVTGGVIANTLKAGVMESIPEGLQGGQESLAQNAAIQRQGYNVPTMRGVFAQGTMEGLAGFGAGGAVGAAQGAAPRLDDRNLPPIQPATFTPPPAAATVDIQEAFGDANAEGTSGSAGAGGASGQSSTAVGGTFNYDGSRGGAAGARVITEVSETGEVGSETNPRRSLVSFGDRDANGAMIFVDPRYAAETTPEAGSAASSYNPDDFEPVAEEPSAPIVTEPPAAPAFQFNLADDTATAPQVDAGADVFSGAQRQAAAAPAVRPAFQFDLADDTATAPEMDAVADVFSGVPKQQTPVVAQEPEVVAPVESPVDAAREPDAQPQLATAQAAPSSFAQAFRTAKSTEDKRLAVLKAVANGTIVSSVVEAAESGKPLPSIEKFKDAFPYEGVALPGRVDLSKVAIKPIKPAAPDIAAKSHTAKDSSRFVLEGVYYDAEAQSVVGTDGRRLIAIPQKVEGKSRIISATDGREIQGQFPNWRQIIPKVDKDTILFNVDIDKARRAGTVLSGINKTLKSLVIPAKVKVGMATLDPSYVKDSVEALVASGAKKVYAASKDDASPVMLRGDNGAMAIIMPMRGGKNELVVDASTVIGEVIGNEGSEVRQMFADADPNTPAKRSLRRIKNMTAQSGAIDLSIVEDLVEYGKTIYRAGMSFGKWAGQMVKEFGQGIASFLKQAFDRIVQAYKDSPYSDTTGAVGNVQPKRKPRQFEEKAKKSDAVTEEAKAELGSEYVPITLQGTAEQAKAWINQNGLDAAEQRILDLAADSLTPTPIDFGIGLEMAARLGAMGEHQRQARVVRIMSNRATSIGQTISVLAMMSRLTPEGIVFYANQIIEQHIDSLPEERQKPIRAAQESIISAEKETKQTRKTVAEETIISGTQGGEKIQEKLKRRIPDKAQKQRTNVGIRSVLTSEATKAEATKQIAQLLTESGISESEAGALSTAITSRFYKVLDKSRRVIATKRYPKEPKLIKIWSKLVAKLNGEGMSDADFIASLSLVAKLPTMTPELGAKLKNLTRQLNEAKGDEDMQLVIAGRIFEEVHSLVPVDFWIKVRAFSYIMMLFSPRTWIRNIGGNTIQWVANAGADTALNIVGGRVGILSNGKTGDRLRGGRLKSLLTPVWDIKRGMEWNAKQNPQATLGQNLAAGIDHLRLLSKLTTQNKFEIADAKEVGRRVFSSKFMNMLDTSLSIALGAPDRAFWKSGLEASLNNREAIAIQTGEWTGRHTPEDVDGAYADAAAAIYQNANTISRESAKLRSSLNRGSTKLLSYFLPGVKPTDQFGFGTALMAFTQVPGAIVRSSINWSPLGIITNLSQAMNGILWKASNQRAGKPFNQQEFAKAFTRALGGTGIYVAGYYLYAMGIITASQEDDDDLEAMRKASGMGQYRINVTALKRLLGSMAWGAPQKAEDGDQILSYDWAQPLAITFAAGAELAKMVEQNDRNGIKKGLAAKAAMPAISLAAGAKSLLELPLLSGLSSFIDQIDTRRPETAVSAVSRTVMGMPSMFVPQLVRQAGQLSDNTARETRGNNPSSAIPVAVQRAFNQIAANTPGVSDQFPPRMDVLGMAQERYQYGGNTVFNVLINPSLTSRVKTNPALQEVERLMQSTGETRQFPRAVSRMADINGKKIDLTNEQISAYQYYLGNYTMSMFNWRMASPRYARLPDIEKVKLLAQDLEDVNASTKSYLFGHDVQRLTRRQRSMRANLANSPLGQSMPPR
jgi:hypothetical protein